MADCAWMSVAAVNTDIVIDLRNDVLFSEDEDSRRAYLAACGAASRGELVPYDVLPKTFFAWRGAHDDSKPLTKRLPHLTRGDFWLVSSETADILGQFDLGGCKLHPVEVLMEDRKTPLPGRYFVLNFDSWKDVFLPEQSPEVAMMEGSNKRRMPYFMTPDDAAALSSDALHGADIWWNPLVLGAFFLSDRLVQALSKAGLDKPFSLRRCRIV